MRRPVTAVALFAALCLAAFLCPHSPCRANHLAAQQAALQAHISAQHQQALILAMMLRAHQKQQQAQHLAAQRLAAQHHSHTGGGTAHPSPTHFQTNTPRLALHPGKATGPTPSAGSPATPHTPKTQQLVDQGLSPHLAQALGGDHKKPIDWHSALATRLPRHDRPAERVALVTKPTGPASHDPKDVAHWLRSRADPHFGPGDRPRDHRDWVKNPALADRKTAPRKDRPSSSSTPAPTKDPAPAKTSETAPPTSTPAPDKDGKDGTHWVRNAPHFPHDWRMREEERGRREDGHLDRHHERDPFEKIEVFFGKDHGHERLIRFEDRRLHGRRDHDRGDYSWTPGGWASNGRGGSRGSSGQGGGNPGGPQNGGNASSPLANSFGPPAPLPGTDDGADDGDNWLIPDPTGIY